MRDIDVIGIARRLTGQYTDITNVACREDIGVGHAQVLDHCPMMEGAEQTSRQAYGVIDVHILHLMKVAIVGSSEVTLFPVSLHGM